MANGIQLNTPTVFGGLGTQTFTASAAGDYQVDVNISIPYQPPGSSSLSSADALSALTALVKLNSTTKLTLSSPSAQQPTLAGSVLIPGVVATDVITVVLTSSNAADNALNAIKGTINLYTV